MVWLAAASIDISPSRFTELSGFVDRRGPAQGIADILEANVVVFLGDEPAAIVALDLLYAGEVSVGLQSELAELIDPARLLIVASHTHFAPATDGLMPELGAVDGEYVSDVVRKVAALIRRLLGEKVRGGAACFSYTRHSVPGMAVSRRRPSWLPDRLAKRMRAKVVFAPYAGRPVDDTQHVVWLAQEGESLPTALLWSYGCHPVSFPRRHQVSAEYPGLVRRRLREQWGDHLPVLFLQGCSSETRPLFTAMFSPKARDLIKQLLSPGPVFRAPAMSEWRQWAERFFVAIPPWQPAHAKRISTVICRRVDSGPVDDIGLELQTFALGDVVKIVAFNAELSAEAGRIATSEIGVDAIPVSCMGRVIGYWPSTKSLSEGGYEATGSRRFFAARTIPSDPDGILREYLKKASESL